MSSARAGQAAPARAPQTRPAPRAKPLALVPPVPARRPRAPFVVLVVALLTGGLVALLLLNTVLAQDAFVLYQLRQSVKLLSDEEQALEQSVARAHAPDTLARRARELGMVPSDTPAFLRLPDGRVLGEPRPATLPPAPPAPRTTAPTARTPPSPSTPRPGGVTR